MFAKEIKLAEKLIKKNRQRDGILLLLRTLVQLNETKNHSKKEYETASLLFASILAIKNYRAIIAEYTAKVSQSSVLFLLNIAVEFGQLKGAIAAIEEFYSLSEMGLELLGYYLDVLDSFMEREKALAVVNDYLMLHPTLSLGNLTAAHIAEVLKSIRSISIEGIPANSDENIDFFSVLFKIVKIQYCEGRLDATAALVHTLQPTVNSNPQIQWSKIKNGYNYFYYISKLISLKKNASQDLDNRVYMIGDSHCLSPAWDEIQLQNKTYIIKPLLVTGCKIWHLRDSSRIHAKVNFYRAIDHVPMGSVAIFIFGEIDCREGILAALRKGAYSSPKQAIKLLIDIYVKRMLEVLKARALTHLYIHQIPPVLVATRSIVNEFNELLEQRIRSLGNNKISWLGFEGQLLNEQGELNANFNFDETHLHPSYIRTAVYCS